MAIPNCLAIAKHMLTASKHVFLRVGTERVNRYFSQWCTKCHSLYWLKGRKNTNTKKIITEIIDKGWIRTVSFFVFLLSLVSNFHAQMKRWRTPPKLLVGSSRLRISSATSSSYFCHSETIFTLTQSNCVVPMMFFTVDHDAVNSG